jgi:MinD-like ATPase involved in chromosome partitioning or flagellar assembly
VDIARQLKIRKMLLLINKVLESMNAVALKKKVEEAYNTTVAGIFTLSEDVVELASEGVFCLRYPDHPVTQEFLAVTRQFME